MSDSHESRPRADSSDIAFRKIFIGGLSYSTDEDKLRKYFQVYGTVQDAVVMKDPISKRSRGFGFITFYDIGSVDVVLANEPHTIDQRKVEAKRAVPRSEIGKESNGSSRPVSSSSTPIRGTPTSSPQLSGLKPANVTSPTTTPSYPDGKYSVEPKYNLEDYAYNKIFVGGLHYDTRDHEFREYFEKYGRVVSAEVMFNRETHKSRGFGFIVFETEDSAIRVCQDKEHIIDGKVVEVKRAIPRSKMYGSSMVDDSPTSIANIRSDVRRTMSAGNAQFLGPNTVLSSNSSTLAASAGVPKVPTMSGGYSTQRKPFSTAVSPPAGRSINNTSYASALKLGAADTAKDCSLQGLLSPSFSSNSMDGSEKLQVNNQFDNEFSDLNSLLRPNFFESSVRTVRAQSEPIVRVDGLFGRDMFSLDINSFGVTSTPQNSKNTSRSSSIYLSNNNLGGLFSPGGDSNFGGNLNSNNNNPITNLSWLTSPQQARLSFDGSMDSHGLLSLSLPPPAVSSNKLQDNTIQSPPGVIGFSNNHHNTQSSIVGMNSSFTSDDSPQQYVKFPLSTDCEIHSNSHTLFSDPLQSNSLSLFGDVSQNSDFSKSNPGVVPSPEKWAAMFGGVGNSQANCNFISLQPDRTWNGMNSLQEPLFNELNNDNNSRVLGLTSSQRSGTTTTESSDTSTVVRRNSHPPIPKPADIDSSFDVNSISQYSDLRLDSQEFVPQGSLHFWSSTT